MQFQFDASQVQPNTALEAIPPADYPVVITASEPKPTKANDGQYFVELTLEIIDGQYRGRKLLDRLNIYNKNPQAVEIAYKSMSAYCHVTGVMNIQDTVQLHNIPFIAVVGYNASTGYNEVKGVKDRSGNQPGKAGQQQAAPAPAAQQQSWQPQPAPAAPPAYAAPATPNFGPPAPPATPPPNAGWAPPANVAPAAPPSAPPQFQQPPTANQPPVAPTPAAPPWAVQPNQPQSPNNPAAPPAVWTPPGR